MDKEKRMQYLKELILRNKFDGYDNLQLWEIMAPLNEAYNLTIDKMNDLLERTINEDKKNYKRREGELPRKD